VRAVVLRAVDGDLAVEDVPEPEGEDGTVLDVRAAGINFADVLIRRGRYPQMPELPHVLGNEVAGDLGGRPVLALPRRSGGYAERVEIDPRWTFDLPDGASYAEGASFLTTFLTAYVPLLRQLRVTPDRTVLVHAGSGGVGVAAIQIAKRLLGARVVATASSDEKRAFALEHGADEALGYDDLADLRVDVVYDPVGGAVFAQSLKLLKPLGSIVAVGFAGGQWQPLDPALVVGRNISVVGFYLGRLMALDPEYVRGCAGELVGLWGRGVLQPVVGAEFALEDAADAHALIESRRHVGKVVLTP
jgi:NADPH2:quinone reductase